MQIECIVRSCPQKSKLNLAKLWKTFSKPLKSNIMDTISIISILITLCAVFGYLNLRFIGLPTAVGIMVLALVFSMLVLLTPHIGLDILPAVQEFMSHIDFSKTLMQGMLSILLFAGALHVKLENLREEKLMIFILAGFGTVFSALAAGAMAYYIFPVFGFDVPLLYALIFGALIAPTDPVAVMAILKKVGVRKSLETKIVGESLFNDAVAVVMFVVILQVMEGAKPDFASISFLLLKEVIGGTLLGLTLGYIVYRMIARIDHYPVEIMLTLALVIGGYELALLLNVSGPIVVVVAGLLIGNYARNKVMSEHNREYLDAFWELCDEFLNAVLFLLIGLEIFALTFNLDAYKAGMIMIPVLLAIRFLSVAMPMTLLRKRRVFSDGAIGILTWGALRGGVPVALALSLPPSAERDYIIIVTYCIVLFSIIVQGLTVGKVVEKLCNK